VCIVYTPFLFSEVSTAIILFRQSGGPIGDMLFTAHYMFHQKLLGNTVLAAIPTTLNPEIKKLYENLTFIDGIIELDFFLDDEKFLFYCSEMGYLPCRFLLDTQYLRGLNFQAFNNGTNCWFMNPVAPSIDTRNAIGFQVSIANHYDRPVVSNLNAYIDLVIEAGLEPVFFGTKKDECLFINSYPALAALYSDSDFSWRFGKDGILQTMANIRNLRGHIVFSSGTSPMAVFQGVPVLELWTKDQWQFFSPMIHYMMGSPIHHITQSYEESPSPHLIKGIFPRLKMLSQNLYNIK